MPRKVLHHSFPFDSWQSGFGVLMDFGMQLDDDDDGSGLA
jgi:hypothetical protein